MRGKRYVSRKRLGIIGITPADAGKTIVYAVNAAHTWDHPRGCGENRLQLKMGFTLLGSPPRMRGKLTYLSICAATVRITPADAGKTLAAGTVRVEWKDHPRGCGENFPALRFAPSRVGSPPRMRGKPAEAVGKSPAPRITPADAGKT